MPVSLFGPNNSAEEGRSDVWLTPAFVLEALGEFDLDPCAPAEQPWPTARRTFTEADDGLAQEWFGRVFLNPPYSVRLLSAFMGKMAAHGHGTALVFARTETRVFFEHVWQRATALLFLRNRLTFHEPSGRRSDFNAGAPSVLVAYGRFDADVLAEEPIDGAFVPLRIERRWIVEGYGERTWREVVEEFFHGRGDEPVTLAEIYRAFASHPKARRNRNYDAKIRQTLQRGRYVSVGRGQWARQGGDLFAAAGDEG